MLILIKIAQNIWFLFYSNPQSGCGGQTFLSFPCKSAALEWLTITVYQCCGFFSGNFCVILRAQIWRICLLSLSVFQLFLWYLKGSISSRKKIPLSLTTRFVLQESRGGCRTVVTTSLRGERERERVSESGGHKKTTCPRNNCRKYVVLKH